MIMTECRNVPKLLHRIVRRNPPQLYTYSLKNMELYNKDMIF